MHEERYKRTTIPVRDLIIMAFIFLWVLVNGWILADKYGKTTYRYSYDNADQKPAQRSPAPSPAPVITPPVNTDSVKTAYETRIAALEVANKMLNERLDKVSLAEEKLAAHAAYDKKIPRRDKDPKTQKKTTPVVPVISKSKPGVTPPPVLKPAILPKDDVAARRDSAKKTFARIAPFFTGVSAKPMVKTETGFEPNKKAEKVNALECCIHTNKRFNLDKPVRVYFTVISPDGHVINGHRTEDYNRLFSFRSFLTTQNTSTEQHICCKIPMTQTLTPGNYLISIYTLGGKIGEAIFKLN